MTTKKDTLTIGVAGLGYWGPNLTRNFVQSERSKVTWVCDYSPQRCQRMQKLYPWVQVTDNFEQMLDAPDIDAVAIATPPPQHYQMVKEALEHGKHVLVAKPMTETVKQAEELVQIATKNNLTLMVDHTFVYSSAVRKIKQLIINGTLGDIFYFDSVRVNPWLSMTGPEISVIRDLATHDISIVVYLFDTEPEVTALTAMNDGNDLVGLSYISLKINERVLGHIFTNRLSPLKIRRTMVGGAKGLVLYDDTEISDKIKLYEQTLQFDAESENPHTPTNRLGGVYIPALDAYEPLQAEAQHFIDSVLKQTPPITDGEFGLKVMRVQERCEELACAQIKGTSQ